jgi:hypothetical protein
MSFSSFAAFLGGIFFLFAYVRVVVRKTVQLSRLWFKVAVLAADRLKVRRGEEKMRRAPRGDVVMLVGGSLMRERVLDSLCAKVCDEWPATVS